jgi:hypothetical protein
VREGQPADGCEWDCVGGDRGGQGGEVNSKRGLIGNKAGGLRSGCNGACTFTNVQKRNLWGWRTINQGKGAKSDKKESVWEKGRGAMRNKERFSPCPSSVRRVGRIQRLTENPSPRVVPDNSPRFRTGR